MNGWGVSEKKRPAAVTRRLSCWRRLDEAHLEGNAGHLALVDRDIDGVSALAGKGKLLEVQDEVSRGEEERLGKEDFEGGLHGRDDGMAVFVHKEDCHIVQAFFFLAEKDAERDGALRVDGGERAGDNGIEGAKEAEFPLVVRCGIAQGGDLNFHSKEGEVSREEREDGIEAIFSMVGEWEPDISIRECRLKPIRRLAILERRAKLRPPMHDTNRARFGWLLPKGRTRIWIGLGVAALLGCAWVVWGLTARGAIGSSGGIYFFRGVALSVPPFRQGDPRWHHDPLGKTKDTLGATGCAVTSAAMVLKSYGVDTDPQRLNAYLTTHGGYVGSGYLVWEKAAELGHGGLEKAYEDLPSYWGIDWQLIQGNPVIVRMHLPGGETHFVVIAGKRGFDYLILDPGAGWNRGLYPLKEITRKIDGLRFYRKTEAGELRGLI